MAGVSSILQRLDTAQREYLDRLVHQEPQLSITNIHEAIEAAGMPISRSALGRHIKLMRSPKHNGDAVTTLAIVINPQTGDSTTIALPFSYDSSVAMLRRHSKSLSL